MISEIAVINSKCILTLNNIGVMKPLSIFSKRIVVLGLYRYFFESVQGGQRIAINFIKISIAGNCLILNNPP